MNWGRETPANVTQKRDRERESARERGRETERERTVCVRVCILYVCLRECVCAWYCLTAVVRVHIGVRVRACVCVRY